MARFFRDELHELLVEWRARVLDDPQVPQAERLSTPALNDHIPVLISQLADRFELLPEDAERAGRVVGMTDTAHEHALLRFDQDYDLRAALREFAIFRQVVLDRVVERGIELDHEVALAFHAAIDQAQATSALEMERLRSEALQASAEQLRREAMLRERFLAMLSHDLRTPLQTVVLGAQTLRAANDDSNARATKTLDRIVANGERMARMIEDILDFARTRLGTLPLRPAAVDAAALARQIAAEMAALHPERHVHVHCEGDAVGLWDGDRLAQVLSNLIGNALTHGAENAPVYVTVRGENQFVTLNVHNVGLPMSAEAIEHAFEPYFRASTERSGLGLGLFIVHEIVHAHGGEVEVTSSELDGTSFRVTLPRAVPWLSPRVR